MKNKLAIFTILSIAMLLTSTTGIVFAPISVPHNRDAMWVEPTAFAWNTATTSVGYTFNITVCMNVSFNVFSYQIGLLYPRSFLQCNKAGYTAGAQSIFMAGHTTSSPPPVIDTSSLGNGSILAFESLMGVDFIQGPHAESLMWAEFTIIKAPPKGGQLADKFDLTTKTPSDNWIQDDNSQYPNFTAYDASIIYTWSPPTAKPFMGIEGPSAWPLVYGPNPPNVTGQTFLAKVYVDNIDPAWYLNNVTFTLTWNQTVIDTVGGLGNVTISGADWGGVVDSDMGGVFTFFANYIGTQGTSTKLLVATMTFTIMMQGGNPPQTAADISKLTFSGVAFFDHTLPITADTPQQGEVDVLPLITLKMPWLQVSPTISYVGPAPSIGSIICVNVDVHNLTKNWHTVAIQFRLQYDDALLSLVSVSEGPFMLNPVWDKYGTFFTSIDNVGGDGTYPFTHALVLDLLYPNASGIYDQNPFPNAPLTAVPETPNVNPTVATFCFKVLQQNCFGTANITTALKILPMWPPTDQNFIDADANYIPDLPGVNGTVVIQALNFAGRQIDLYGGAVNDGYGVLVGSPYLQFPAPYGGQGPNHYMDIVFPQSWIYLNANVTYNYWPVQKKDVGFEIEGPYIHMPDGSYVPAPTYQILAKFTATTDSNGVANYSFRMPWPCDFDLTGVWKITSTVTLADQVVSDTMMFYYQHQVYITGVTTDAYGYYHDGYVKVTVKYSTHSVETYPALFAVVITDDLGVPIGMALYSTTVGGAVFCTWKNGTFSVSIFIPKWAYAGNGYVHVSVYDKDPTVGGEAIGPEFTPAPQINIYPYNVPLSISIDKPITQTLNNTINITTSVNNETIHAVALGGYPLMQPGDIPVYWYDWYVDGTWKQENLGTTSTPYFFDATVLAKGVYIVSVVATDASGNTATVWTVITVVS